MNEFKAGDRVHVTRINGEEVNFYGTLTDLRPVTAALINCTDESYDFESVWLPSDEDFGPKEEDYYTLATEKDENKERLKMPTIKTKKEMTLPQLIEWATENDVRNKSFCGDRYCDEVSFDENKDMTCEYITINEIFTVEIEEEITEDTIIPKLVEFMEIECEDGTVMRKTRFMCDTSINKEKDFSSSAFYMLNNDKTMTLIWTREDGLVE